MDLQNSLVISASGLRAQSERMRVIAENLANADSTALVPDGDPYRRKIVTFANVLDRERGVSTVQVSRIMPAPGQFGTRFDPNHPAADGAGYVATPNVNTLVEMMDMRQAQRSYEANLSAMETSKAMLVRTIDLLK